MKKIIKKFVGLGMATMLLAGCGGNSGGSETSGDSGKSDGLNVGIVLPTKDESRWLQDEETFRKLFEEKGYNAEITFSQQSSATEKQNVETFITKGADVILICPIDGVAAAAAADAAAAEGITVISYDRLITETENVDYYVTFDSFSVGNAQGQYLVDNAEGTGNPLYLYAGAASDNNAYIFFDGAWNALQPKIADGTFVIANSSAAEKYIDKQQLTREEISEIIGQVETAWNPSEAKKKAEAHLTTADSTLKGEVFILGPNDDTARAIGDVFAEDAEVTSYWVTGQDATVASGQYIIDGKQSMTVFKDTRVLANDAMQLAVDVIEGGGNIETTSTYNNGVKDVLSKQSEVIVVDKNNIKKELVDSGYYEASNFEGLE